MGARHRDWLTDWLTVWPSVAMWLWLLKFSGDVLKITHLAMTGFTANTGVSSCCIHSSLNVTVMFSQDLIHVPLSCWEINFVSWLLSYEFIGLQRRAVIKHNLFPAFVSRKQNLVTPREFYFTSVIPRSVFLMTFLCLPCENKSFRLKPSETRIPYFRNTDRLMLFRNMVSVWSAGGTRNYHYNVKSIPVTGRGSLCDVQAPTFSRQSVHRWRWSRQPYTPAALYRQEDSWYSFLLETESIPWL
jgi:hypothetical protein